KILRGNRICFGRYALQALEPLDHGERQIEAGRRAITRYARRGGKIWVYISRQTGYTKTHGNTYGLRKVPEYWVAVVKPGRILYERWGVSETVARAANSISASKIPIRSQFLRLEI
ncbi:hypothetical protein ZWY2020_029128, partial [Hordeum vulgare]